MTNFWLYLALASVLIIFPLAVYAGRLLYKVKQQKVKQAVNEKNALLALQTHDGKIFDSAILIAKAMVAEQCELSEACWRIVVLLESLKTVPSFANQFPAIYQHYDNIKHLSILADRKELPKKERMRQDFQRLKFEAEALAVVETEMNQLMEHLPKAKEQLNHSILH